MNPQDIEAVAQRIAASAALADGEVEAEVEPQSDAVEAALAVEAVLREVSGGSKSTAVPAEADEPESDEAWFAANPGRTARLRPHQPGDRRSYWADDGQALMSVVRFSPKTMGAPFAEALPADALREPVADTDEAVLAAVRSARGCR